MHAPSVRPRGEQQRRRIRAAAEICRDPGLFARDLGRPGRTAEECRDVVGEAAQSARRAAGGLHAALTSAALILTSLALGLPLSSLSLLTLRCRMRRTTTAAAARRIRGPLWPALAVPLACVRFLLGTGVPPLTRRRTFAATLGARLAALGMAGIAR